MLPWGSCPKGSRFAFIPSSDPARTGPALLRVELPAPLVSANPCQASSTSLCLTDGRFQVSLEWRAENGTLQPARAHTVGANDSGFFSFFDNDNLELLVKVLDACGLEGGSGFWVFVAGATTLEYTLTVTDTVTGRVRKYHNPPGRPAQAVADTAAFSTCS